MLKHELEALVKHGVTVEEFDVVEAWYMKRVWATKEDAAQVWRAMFLRDAKEREQARRVFDRKQNLELGITNGLDGADPIFRATHYASSGMWGVEAA